MFQPALCLRLALWTIRALYWAIFQPILLPMYVRPAGQCCSPHNAYDTYWAVFQPMLCTRNVSGNVSAHILNMCTYIDHAFICRYDGQYFCQRHLRGAGTSDTSEQRPQQTCARADLRERGRLIPPALRRATTHARGAYRAKFQPVLCTRYAVGNVSARVVLANVSAHAFRATYVLGNIAAHARWAMRHASASTAVVCALGNVSARVCL